MAEIRCDWHGKKLHLDLDSINAREYKTIRSHTGLKIGQFERAIFRSALDGIDPEPVEALYWLMLRRAGQEDSIGSEDDSFTPKAFINACVVTDDAAEDDEDQDPKGSGVEPGSI